MLCFGRSALTFKRGTACSLSSFSPVGSGALTAGVLWLLEERISIRDAEIFAVGKIAESPRFSGEEDSSLQTAFPFYILAEGGDIVDGKRIGVLMECSGAERRQNDNLLIPYAHKGKSSDNWLDRSLDRALTHF